MISPALIHLPFSSFSNVKWWKVSYEGGVTGAVGSVGTKIGSVNEDANNWYPSKTLVYSINEEPVTRPIHRDPSSISLVHRILNSLSLSIT